MKTDKIKIYNTLSGKKDRLSTIKKNRVNLFVCGPTVYDFPHMGHARTYVIFDAFVKYLKSQKINVFYLQNITDLDDKIIARAREKGVSPKSLAEAFEKEYLKSMKDLGITSVTKYARATSHIKEILNQIERLIKKGYAYKIEDGIYYDISKFKRYGNLSRRTVLAAEDAVSRIDYSKSKKNRGDFCLWKFCDPGEPSWPSSFGKGRPGWHIEDTAIAEKFFGPQYDIHGGGRDLIFPHHEAEIAQMEAVSSKNPFVKYWMHTGFLTIQGQKMSKSLGNFITISDFLKRYSKEHLRFLIVKNLWHSPLDYSESVMIEVKSTLEKIEEFLRKIEEIKQAKSNVKNFKNIFEKAEINFYNQLADDFNTPKAFGVIFDIIKEMNKFIDSNSVSKSQAKTISAFFNDVNNIFGIIDNKKIKKIAIPSKLKQLIADREIYRNQQEWQKADQARIEIEKMGYQIKDTKTGPTVKKVKS